MLKKKKKKKKIVAAENTGSWFWSTPTIVGQSIAFSSCFAISLSGMLHLVGIMMLC